MYIYPVLTLTSILLPAVFLLSSPKMLKSLVRTSIKPSVCLLAQAARPLSTATHTKFLSSLRQTGLYTSAREFDLDQNDDHILKSEIEHSIDEFASKPLPKLTMDWLVRYGDDITPNQLLQNAIETSERLKISLARRLFALRSLPYLVVLNPSISSIYGLYLSSFNTIASTSPDSPNFVNALEKIIQTHTDTLPHLSRGFKEVSTYIDPDSATEFLNLHLQDRIQTRTLARHHIALANSDNDQQSFSSSHIGSIDTNLNLSKLLYNCNLHVSNLCSLKYDTKTDLIVDKGENVNVKYIPTHIEYVFTELLKNSSRALLENSLYHEHCDDSRIPPVLATIVPTNSGGAVVRLRDRGGGIAPEIEEKIFNYAFTSVKKKNNDNNVIDDHHQDLDRMDNGLSFDTAIAGMGYGLPLSRQYLEMFGGSLEIQSYYGWGVSNCNNL